MDTAIFMSVTLDAWTVLMKKTLLKRRERTILDTCIHAKRSIVRANLKFLMLETDFNCEVSQNVKILQPPSYPLFSIFLFMAYSSCLVYYWYEQEQIQLINWSWVLVWLVHFYLSTHFVKLKPSFDLYMFHLIVTSLAIFMLESSNLCEYLSW